MNGDITPLPCETTHTLGHVSGVDLSINSEKNRFSDVPYTISFIPKGEEEAVADTTSTLVVVNASISPEVAVATTTPPVIVPPETKPEPTKPATTTPVTPVTPKPPVKPTYVQTYTYAIPVSNPNGFTDIATTFIKVGTISNGAIVTDGVIDNDTSATLLFEVKNIGTKTSNTFTYSVALPNGTTYVSGTQVALKPNERATIALGFDVANIIGIKSLSVNVTSSGETSTANNGFAGTITITD